jgi:hypothetical protein
MTALSTLTARLIVSQHAISEAVRDFRIDKRVAEDWVRSNYRKAAFVSDIVSEEGKACRLFAYQRIAFILADTEEYVITVYPRHTAIPELSAKVSALLQRELRKAARMERTIERRVRVEKSRLKVERAECKWRMEITPSASVKRANTLRIAQIDKKLAELDRELFDAKKAKSSVAKSVIMYM